MEVQCDVVALLVEIDDVEILNRFLEGESQVQLKRNRPQAVIVQRHLFGKQDNLSNLTDIGWSELIGEIRLDLLRGRIIKPEVVVEPSRTIHKVVVELIQAVPVADESFLTDAAAMDMEDTGTNKYQKLVKSGIGSIIYSHSATDIPVHLSPGKYILKSVDPKTGAITVIAKRLNIKDVYMLKAEKNKDCIYWFHRI